MTVGPNGFLIMLLTSMYVCLFRIFKLRRIMNMNIALEIHDIQNSVIVIDMQMSAHVGVNLNCVLLCAFDTTDMFHESYLLIE